MGIVSYKPLIQEMTWSFSRIESFEDCPYRWYLHYIRQYPETEKFYASFGSFLHRLIEKYYRGELNKEQMLSDYLSGFQKEVNGVRPAEGTLKKYIESGASYLKAFQPFPFEMVDVEKKVQFQIDGYSFVGFIDFLGKDGDDLVVVDHKSRDLKPRSKRSKPTRKDRELDDMLRQLYLYSAAIEQEYGMLPKWLCFNCFKSGTFIQEPFDHEAYEGAKRWAIETIHKIEDAEVFPPVQDGFGCFWICGVSDLCKYDIADREERRRSG